MSESLSEFLNFKEILLEITLGFMLMGIALLFPYRKMPARPEIGWDIVGMVCLYLFAFLYTLIEYPAYDWLVSIDWIEHWQNKIWALPLWLVIPFNFVLADFAAYWAHRLLHASWFWSSHAWHHSGKYLYWLSGLRAAPIHSLMRFLPYTVVYLFIPLPDLGLAITIIFFVNTLNQHYTHSNIRLPFQKQLEFVFVTPRFHFVHHISTRMHTDSNYGFVFSFWDRIFGTYTNPDEVDNNAPMGLDYDISNIRLLLGIPGAKVQRQSKQSEDNILGKTE